MKVGETDYVSIQDIWGKPPMSKPMKTKIQSITPDENTRKPKEPRLDKKTPEKIKIPKFPPPPPEKPEISQLLPKKEQFKIERLRIKQEKEMAWELRRLCHNFLENNDKDWLKRKIQE